MKIDRMWSEVSTILDTSDEKTAWQAACRLAKEYTPGLADKRAQKQLYKDAKPNSPESYLQEQLMPPEILNVLSDGYLSQPRPIRIGKKWVTGEDGTKIKIKKSTGEPRESMHRPPAEYHVETQVASKTTEEHEEISATNNKEIVSPMVGTFYRAPSPEAPPFVEVGQELEMGQVVCIIEAMKLMNEIKAEVKGKSSKILVDNAQPVEFGQPLFIVEPL